MGSRERRLYRAPTVQLGAGPVHVQPNIPEQPLACVHLPEDLLVLETKQLDLRDSLLQLRQLCLLALQFGTEPLRFLGSGQ